MKNKLVDVCIEILQKCPHKCIYCSSNSTPTSEPILPLDKILEIIDFGLLHDVQNISLSGGEPMLHPDIIEIIKYLNEKCSKYYIYTSGNYSAEILELLNYCDKDKALIVFNYQSTDSDEFIKISGTDHETFCRVCDNIQATVENKFNVELNIVPNRINLYNLYNTIMCLQNIGVKKVNLLRFVAQGRGLENRRIFDIDNYFDDALGNVVQDVRFGALTSGFVLRCGIPLGNIEDDFKHVCKAGFQKLVFNFSGNVYPCEAFKGEGEAFILGNIYKDTLEDIYRNGINHEGLKTLRQTVKNSKDYNPCVHKN